MDALRQTPTELFDDGTNELCLRASDSFEAKIEKCLLMTEFERDAVHDEAMEILAALEHAEHQLLGATLH